MRVRANFGYVRQHASERGRLRPPRQSRADLQGFARLHRSPNRMGNQCARGNAGSGRPAAKDFPLPKHKAGRANSIDPGGDRSWKAPVVAMGYGSERWGDGPTATNKT